MNAITRATSSLIWVGLHSAELSGQSAMRKDDIAIPSPESVRRKRDFFPDRETGYLSGREPDFLQILPPFPPAQSAQEAADMAQLDYWRKSAADSRRKLAEADTNLSYTRFGEAFGGDISTTSTPLLTHLLDRVEADMTAPLRNSKRHYERPRPQQSARTERICPSSYGGSSYPSGHAVFGWAAALVLAAVAPERAQAILARGKEYGESRVICGVHYPSDITAGQMLVSAVFNQLQSNPEFQHDLTCAKKEREVVRNNLVRIPPECLVGKDQPELRKHTP